MKRSLPLVLLLLAAAFLFVRAAFPQRWGEWMFGDVQTMLAVENWREDGFERLNFLWVPQGYAKITSLFDAEPLRHHAHGSWVGDGYRRIYTHYPSWYAVPYGVLGKLGIYHKSIYQAFAILLSLGSLVFLYLFVEKLFDGRRALWVVGGYFFYLGFLEYCDSLSNIPYDDFFRFAFMYTWQRAVREPFGKFHEGAWGIYFLSCLTSLDSILYIYLFLLLYQRQRPLIWIKFALAPVIALGICFLQNVGYLGFEGALLDWQAQRGAFSFTRSTDLSAIFKHLTIVLEKSAGVFLLLPLFLYYDRLQVKSARRLVLILALAGMAYPFVFPSKVIALGYQLRQAAPALLLMWATIVTGWGEQWRRREAPWKVAAGALAIAIATYFIHLQRLPRALDFPPVHRLPAQNVALFQEVIQTGDRVYFEYRSGLEQLNTIGGYPQIHPLYEFVGKGPILGFPDIESLRRDLCLLESKAAAAPFTAFVVTQDDPALIAEFEGKVRLEPVGRRAGKALFQARCAFATYGKFD